VATRQTVLFEWADQGEDGEPCSGSRCRGGEGLGEEIMKMSKLGIEKYHIKSSAAIRGGVSAV